MVYYVSVDEDGVEVVRRKPFDDYCAAVDFFSQFYQPRAGRAVLEFVSEVINGRFARSYASLMIPGALDENDSYFQTRYHVAAKQSNAFRYDHSYFFLIESEVGRTDADDLNADE